MLRPLRRRPTKYLIAVTLWVIAHRAEAMRFECKDAWQRDLVVIQSEATLEKIVSMTSGVTGWIETDLKAATATKLSFEIDLRTLQTTSPGENDFLAKLWAISDNPTARLTLDKFSLLNKSKTAVLTDGASLSLKAGGFFEIRGIKKPVSGTATFTYFKESEVSRQRLPGNLLKFSYRDDLVLADYAAVVPEAMKARFAKNIQLTLDAVADDAPIPSLK